MAKSQLPRHDHGVTDPGHTHVYGIPSGGYLAYNGANNNGAYNLSQQVNTGSSTTGVTVKEWGTGWGGNDSYAEQSSIDNRPLYYALYYIMKV